jgi:hypothetical protein
MPKRRARNHPAAAVLSGVDQTRPFPRFPLTDEQWKMTAKLSGIAQGAVGARHDIETTIGIFRAMQASDLDRVMPAEIRKQLEALAKLAHDLNSGFSKLLDEPDAYTALIGNLEHRRSSDVLDARRLSEVLDVLSCLDWLLPDALCRVEGGKRGPKAKTSTGWLVILMEYGNSSPGKKLLARTRMTFQKNTSPTSAGLPTPTSETALSRRQ